MMDINLHIVKAAQPANEIKGRIAQRRMNVGYEQGFEFPVTSPPGPGAAESGNRSIGQAEDLRRASGTLGRGQEDQTRAPEVVAGNTEMGCPTALATADALPATPAGRYLSMEPHNTGVMTAVRVELSSSALFPISVGEIRWVGQPADYPENLPGRCPASPRSSRVTTPVDTARVAS